MSNKASKENPLSTAEVFMDPNTFKDGATLDDKDSWSESGKFFIYSINKKGSDWQQAYIRNAETLKDFPEELNWLKFTQFDFSKDEKGFFYTRYPAPS